MSSIARRRPNRADTSVSILRLARAAPSESTRSLSPSPRARVIHARDVPSVVRLPRLIHRRAYDRDVPRVDDDAQRRERRNDATNAFASVVGRSPRADATTRDAPESAPIVIAMSPRLQPRRTPRNVISVAQKRRERFRSPERRRDRALAGRDARRCRRGGGAPRAVAQSDETPTLSWSVLNTRGLADSMSTALVDQRASMTRKNVLLLLGAELAACCSDVAPAMSCSVD